MHRRNFLTKILLAIPFVGLAVASVMKGPKGAAKLDDEQWRRHQQAEDRIHRIGMPEAIDDHVHAGMTPEQTAFLEWPPIADWTPEAIDAYVAKNLHYPHDLTDQEWKRYTDACHPNWKDTPLSFVSRESDTYQQGKNRMFGLLYGTPQART